MAEFNPLSLNPAPIPSPGTFTPGSFTPGFFTPGARTFGSKTSGSQAPGRYTHGRYTPSHYAPQADTPMPAPANLPADLPDGRRASDKLLDTLIQHEINYAQVCHDTARFFADQQFPGLCLLLDTQSKHARLFAHELAQHRQTPQPPEQSTPQVNTPQVNTPDPATYHNNIDALRRVQIQCRLGKHLADQLIHELNLHVYSPLPQLLHDHYYPACLEQLWAINFIHHQPREA